MFVSIYLLACKKTSKALHLEQQSYNYSDLLLEIPCKIFFVRLKFLFFFSCRNITEIQSCLLKLPSGEKSREMSFSRTQQNEGSRFMIANVLMAFFINTAFFPTPPRFNV